MTGIKICGLTEIQNTLEVVRLGPDMVGTIVDVGVETPREITRQKANEIFNHVPKNIGKVMVSMIDKIQEDIELLDKVNADYIQIHNSLKPRKLEKIRNKTDKKIIAVLPIKCNQKEKAKIMQHAEELSKVSDFLLLDSASPRGGGTGKTHDWELSSKIREKVDVPIILAGGLRPENVGSAVEKVNPKLVDVSSGVESEPGIKSIYMVKKFIERVD